MQWTSQIRDVLKRDPEVLFIDPAHPPGPLDEIKFWKSKADNLDLIHAQLQSDAVCEIMEDLEKTSSSYLDSFKKIQDEVRLAKDESRDNYRFLMPLRPIVETIRGASGPEEFEVLGNTFRKLFHAIYLIWTRSKYYNTTGRLVVLIREACNDLVEVCRNYITAKEILLIEPSEAVEKLRNVMVICGAFKRSYFSYKNKVSSTHPDNPWRIQLAALFHRLDQFLERVRDVLELVNLGITFSKLSTVKIGGTRGAHLSHDIVLVFEDFKSIHEHFREISYDMLDIEQKQFEEDFRRFRDVVKEQERRIGSIMGKAFEETSTIESSINLIESFHSFLEREIVQRELEKKEMEIIQRYVYDLKQVQMIFIQHKDRPPTLSNMPPTAGALTWSNGLLERITSPLNKIHEVNETLLQTSEGRSANRLFDSISKNIRQYQLNEYEKWAATVSTVYSEKLGEYLLKRDEAGLLFVNFDPQLVRILREVNYISKINSILPESEQFEIPDEASLLFQQVEQYRNQTTNLEIVKNLYNKTVSNLVEVERPLVQKQLEAIDRVLHLGLSQLTWTSVDKDNFIGRIMTMAQEISKIHDTLKTNVDYIRELLVDWSESPFFQYNESRALSVKDFTAKYEEVKKTRMEKFQADALTIHQKLEQSFSVLSDISKSDQIWIDYVIYVNDIIIEGLCHFVVESMKIVRDQIDSDFIKTHETARPLLEIQLCLDRHMDNSSFVARFNPSVESVDGESSDSLNALVHSWIEDFISVAALIARLDTPELDYVEDIRESMRIHNLRHEIENQLEKSFVECNTFKQTFLDFSFLFETDPDQAFSEWIEQNQELEKRDFEIYLTEYKKQIHRYENIEEQLISLPTSNIRDRWLKIDSRPIKSSLKDICIHWKNMFMKHLLHKVESTLEDLYSFMNTVQGGLEKKVEDGDVDTLKEVMGYIRNVKTRAEATVKSSEDNEAQSNVPDVEIASRRMFQPLNNIIALLKEHQCEVNDQIMDQLECAPDKWKTLYQKALDKRENLSKLQDKEANNIKGQILIFNDKVQQFQIDFFNSQAFQWGNDFSNTYSSIDVWYHKILKIQNEAAELHHLQELFDLVPMEYKELRTCMEDIKLLKQLWDMNFHVQSQFNDWMKTPFQKADVNFFLDETKKLLRTLNAFPMKMKSWKSFSGLSTHMENMKTSLPLILSLRDPAMRNRHWQDLLKETHKQGTIDPENSSFSLQEFIDLGLHAYEDVVLGIVEKATRELGIENQLIKIEDTWETMELEYIQHEELNCPVLGSVEEVVENLEDNQVKLQNLAGNRFVVFFSERVLKWQTVLGTVDSIIILWIEVQKTWENLYPIFVLSEDIKVQLPEDAKRFKEVDDSWRALMSAANDVTNVIEACYEDTIQKRLDTDRNLSDKLSELQLKLEMCEKSLAEYLEKKRKAFPRFVSYAFLIRREGEDSDLYLLPFCLYNRFYFVAPADLVDILSKGSFPHLVMPHMPKLVDAISTLTFDGDSNVAVGLISTDDEVRISSTFFFLALRIYVLTKY